ncbi:E3 ubiquitin-protein ligase itt1 [Aspergillus udagawae]|uniref:RBR-type E3 ubiquitin transferase n=1 Tax=Aspergillus udagawae TaxID=91492 RepID=A0A8E0V1G6_9EURO|nr:translation termination inhibitor protein itt1 [Aspergillus udagawae]GFF35797.1 E3 ubiquitin-protein ligase itt1 [Aspergillus udagawae]GFG25924.1 E3 ubiquitin-protein ligase itt1 [Aspergillus udagawae]GIC88589.1 translation termination inhibitor protein itt1 [Aspergillus udagawae]
MTGSDFLSEDERSVELSSIAAIYPEIKIDPASPFRASLDIPVKPSTPLPVCFEQQLDAGFPEVLTPPTSLDASDVGLGFATKDNGRDVHTLSYLPPLSLEIDLPEGYPSEKAPIFRLETNPPWLPHSIILRLVEDGKRLWEECGRDLVVFTYIDHLQQLAETAFSVSDTADQEVQLPRDIKIALLDFNNKAEQEKFEQETFECGVCLEPKKGSVCHRLLLCSHVFCVSCLQDFYNSCITEGDVDSVKCLAPDCGKEKNGVPEAGDQLKKRKKHDRTLSPSELLQIPLDQETVQRYVFLKRKKKLESDKSTVYCPRQWCQGAARSKKHPKPLDPMSDDVDSSDEEEGVAFDPNGDEAQLPPMADRVAICEDCNYAFCSVCKKGWHGELVRCFPRREAELSAEEKATEEYLRLYTSPCPTCDAPCQKRMGCNHMICFKCSTHFCYLCSSWLPEDNPYRHFNDTNSQCYNRLWDLEGGDGIDPEGPEALHRIPNDLVDFDEPSDDEDAPVLELREDEIARRRRPPPPAPVPPQVNQAAGGHGHRNRGNDAHILDAAGRAAAAERQAQARAMAEVRARPVADRPRQHDGQAAVQPPRPGRIHRPGLQRFLDLVQNDREDEWDSDELDDDF